MSARLVAPSLPCLCPHMHDMRAALHAPRAHAPRVCVLLAITSADVSRHPRLATPQSRLAPGCCRITRAPVCCQMVAATARPLPANARHHVRPATQGPRLWRARAAPGLVPGRALARVSALQTRRRLAPARVCLVLVVVCNQCRWAGGGPPGRVSFLVRAMGSRRGAPCRTPFSSLRLGAAHHMHDHTGRHPSHAHAPRVFRNNLC